MKPGAKLATETYLEVRKISGEAWENDFRKLSVLSSLRTSQLTRLMDALFYRAQERMQP